MSVRKLGSISTLNLGTGIFESAAPHSRVPCIGRLRPSQFNTEQRSTTIQCRRQGQFRLIHSINPKAQFSSVGAHRLATETSVVENEQIKSFKVRVVSADNKLGEPITLFDALKARSQDDKGRYTDVLRQVRPAAPPEIFPICKYFSLRAMREKQAQLKHDRHEQAAKRQAKRLELTWKIGDGDLVHRMDRLKEFLGKGRLVEVVLGSQRKRGWHRKKAENYEAAQRLIDKVKGAAMEVTGAKEAKTMTGDMGELVVLYFQGPKTAKVAPPE